MKRTIPRRTLDTILLVTTFGFTILQCYLLMVQSVHELNLTQNFYDNKIDIIFTSYFSFVIDVKVMILLSKAHAQTGAEAFYFTIEMYLCHTGCVGDDPPSQKSSSI